MLTSSSELFETLRGIQNAMNACLNSVYSRTVLFQMEIPATRGVLGTYDYVAVGIYYVVVLTVSIYVSLLLSNLLVLSVNVSAMQDDRYTLYYSVSQ